LTEPTDPLSQPAAGRSFPGGRGIFRNTAFLGAARIAERASGILLAVFIARWLGVRDLGIYSAAFAYYALIAPAGELGFVSLLVREIGKDRSVTNRYLVHASAIAAAASTVAIGLFWLVVPQLSLDAELKESILVIALALLPRTLNLIQEAVFIAHQQVQYQTYVTATGSVVNVVVGLYLLKSGHGLVSLFVVFVAIQYVVTLVYFAIINRRIARIRPEFDRRFAAGFLRDVAPFAGTSFLAAFFSRPEIIMLSLIGTAEQVGFYSAALKIASLWDDVPAIFMANVFPRLSRAYRSAHREFDLLRTKALSYLLAVSLPLSAGIVATAVPLIATVYGSGFDESVTPLRILALGIPLVSLQAVLWRTLSTQGRQGLVFKTHLASVGVRIGGGYLLITLFGTNGAAASVTATLLAHSMLLMIWLNRGGTEVRLREPLWRFGIPAVAMAGLAWALATSFGIWVAVSAAVFSYGLFVFIRAKLSPVPATNPVRVSAHIMSPEESSATEGYDATGTTRGARA
jgi:O-antigen/teichoic acid export membrane protein